MTFVSGWEKNLETKEIKSQVHIERISSQVTFGINNNICHANYSILKISFPMRILRAKSKPESSKEKEEVHQRFILNEKSVYAMKNFLLEAEEKERRFSAAEVDCFTSYPSAVIHTK